MLKEPGGTRAVPKCLGALSQRAMLPTVLSLLVLAAIALTGGAIYLWRKPGMRRQALLMLALAAIALVNLAIWTVPDENGRSPIGRIGER